MLFAYQVRLIYRRDLFFLRSYQLKMYCGLGIWTCVHFPVNAGAPSDRDLFRLYACCHSFFLWVHLSVTQTDETFVSRSLVSSVSLVPTSFYSHSASSSIAFTKSQDEKFDGYISFSTKDIRSHTFCSVRVCVSILSHLLWEKVSLGMTEQDSGLWIYQNIIWSHLIATFLYQSYMICFFSRSIFF